MNSTIAPDRVPSNMGRRRLRARVVVTGVVTTGALAMAGCGESTVANNTGSGGHDVAAAVLSHQFSWGTFHLSSRIADKLRKGQQINIVIDNQGTGIPIFGAEQKRGTDRGCAQNQGKLNISCRLVGPPTTDNTAQLSELETLLNSDQVDCLGLEAPAPDAFVNTVNKYVDKGVPAFTQNADVPDSKRFAFFALDETNSGEINGKVTAGIVKAQGLPIKKIAMGSGNPTAPWAKNRMTGFEKGYKEVIPDAQFVNGPDDALPTGADFTNQEVINSVGPYLSANPDVNLFFHTDQGVEAVGQVIKAKGLTGKVWTSGFNVSAPLLDEMDAGQILVTINQGFDNQAAAAVSACVNYLTQGAVPSNPLAYLQPIVITKDGTDGSQTTVQAKSELQSLGGA